MSTVVLILGAASRAGAGRGSAVAGGHPTGPLSLYGQAPLAQPGFEAPDVDPPADSVGQVLPTGREQSHPLGLGEASPDAVRLLGDECVGRALGPDRAGEAD